MLTSQTFKCDSSDKSFAVGRLRRQLYKAQQTAGQSCFHGSFNMLWGRYAKTVGCGYCSLNCIGIGQSYEIGFALRQKLISRVLDLSFHL